MADYGGALASDSFEAEFLQLQKVQPNTRHLRNRESAFCTLTRPPNGQLGLPVRFLAGVTHFLFSKAWRPNLKLTLFPA
jgi:hypothetical protein